MPSEHGISVDRMATTAGALGLASPDLQGCDGEGEADEIVVVISVYGGLIQDVGARGRDLPRLRVIVTDHDTYETTDGESGVYTESVIALERWSLNEDSALVRAGDELPEDLRRELGLVGPE
jgi:hypothetical protein